jgi:hypothetical protein
MSELPLYPHDYERDYWIEFLLRLVESNPTDTHLEQSIELARAVVYSWAQTEAALDLLQEHRTEWQDYFYAKKELRERLLKMFGGIPLN